jgi:ATP-dependent DNA ligase
MKEITWPMNTLTRKAGATRKLVCHPKKLIERDDMILENFHGDKPIVPEFCFHSSVPRVARFVVETKLQGHRYFFCRDAAGVYHLYSRRLNVAGQFTDALVDKIKCSWQEIPAFKRLERGTCLDGELTWPGHPDSAVPTAMVNCPTELEYTPFAIPFANGVDARAFSYGEARDLIRCYGFQPVDVTLKTQPICSRQELQALVDMLLRKAREENVEGYVLKVLGGSDLGSYRPHYEDVLWYKIKTILECDAFVTGFKVSDSETKGGMVTALEIGVYEKTETDLFRIVHLGSVSGIDDALSTRLTSAYLSFGNRVGNPYFRRPLRVLYQERASQGKLKHGFFDGWRDDKTRHDCTMDQFQ